MNKSKIKAWLVLIGLVVAGIVVVILTFNILMTLLKVAVQLAIIAGIVYLAYAYFKKYKDKPTRNLK